MVSNRPATLRSLVMVACATALALMAGSCSADTVGNSESAKSEFGQVDIAVTERLQSACPTGLNSDGTDMLKRYVDDLSHPLPTYDLAVSIDPATGSVDGSMTAWLPTAESAGNSAGNRADTTSDQIQFRVFPGLDAFDSSLAVTNVQVNGEDATATRDQAVLTIAKPAGDAQDVRVDLDFDYQIDQAAATRNIFGAISGASLDPGQVGLIGRTKSGMQLGHWFPVWLPQGTRADPEPSGFGDIGAFPTAAICAEISTPVGYTVVTSGSDASRTASTQQPLDETESAELTESTESTESVSDQDRSGEGETTIVEGAGGLRDFAIFVSKDLEFVRATVEGVDVRVWGPAGDRDSLQRVLDHSVIAQQALHDSFGPYPWNEIDVVAAPLGGGVGGMEWPGMVWIENTMFAGGVAGLGEIGGLVGDELLSGLLGQIGGDAISTALEWTIAHELGHEWFHALVGNDSITSPAVDEPLAQFAACVAMEQIHPENWRDICDAQTVDQFGMARAIGIPDTAADQATDRFESALQYGAVIYGKAPGFYFAAADLMGWDELVAALRSFVEKYAFSAVKTSTLRDHLGDAAGDNGDELLRLWTHWFLQAKGDDDIEPVSPPGPDLGRDLGRNLEGLEDLEGFGLQDLIEGEFNVDTERLEDLLGRFQGLEDLNLDGLTIDGLSIEDMLSGETGLSDLIDPDSEFGSRLFGDGDLLQSIMDLIAGMLNPPD